MDFLLYWTTSQQIVFVQVTFSGPSVLGLYLVCGVLRVRAGRGATGRLTLMRYRENEQADSVLIVLMVILSPRRPVRPSAQVPC
jgi:hypothetical protein